MRTQRLGASVCTLLLLASLGLSQSRSKLKVEFRPAIPNFVGGPMFVDLSNDGNAVRGEAIQRNEGDEIRFPIDLPSGSRKRILICPRIESYSFDVHVQIGNEVFRPQFGSGYMSSSPVAIFDDEPDAYLKFRSAFSLNRQNVSLFGAKPEDCPDRVSAFDVFRAIWLGRGCDRMNDAQIAALQAYVVGGGTIIFAGGQASATQNDPRWRAIFAERAAPPRNLRAKFIKDQPRVQFLASGAALAGVSQPVIEGIAARRNWGQGRVIALQFSPVDAPLDKTNFMGAVMGKIVAATASRANRDLLADQDGQFFLTARENPNFRTLVAAQVSDAYENTTSIMRSTSFQLPRVDTVFLPIWVFAAVVVPLAILVPRRMNRAQLAWVLIPIASLGFSIFVLSGQGTLRNAQQGQVTQASLLLQAGSDIGVCAGSSELFFARAGRYDLDRFSAERQTVSTFGDYGGRSGPAMSYRDDGKMHVEPITTRNLEVRTLRFRQVLTGVGGWSKVTRSPGSIRNSVIWKVTNTSPHAWHHAMLGGEIRDEPMKPGDTAVFKAMRSDSADPVLIFMIKDLNVGPNLGQNTSHYLARLSLQETR